MHVAQDAASAAGEDRRNGIDPLTLRVLARHGPAGEELLRLAPLPRAFSHSQFFVYRQCHLRYALEKRYRIPSAERKGYFGFGTVVHSAYADFVKRARSARAAGEPPPSFEQLQQAFEEHFDPTSFTRSTSSAALAMSMRRGDFTAMPDHRGCGWCDFARICPSRHQAPEG